MDKIDNNDWDDYYSILGKFVVTFELIVLRIRDECVDLIERRGLQDPFLAEIIFGQNNFTADPLLNCFVSMVNHIIRKRKNSEILISRLSSFKKKFREQIEMRNNILHASHFLVEHQSYTDPKINIEEFRALKLSPKSSGYNLKETPKYKIIESNIKLMEINDEFIEFKNALHRYLDLLKL